MSGFAKGNVTGEISKNGQKVAESRDLVCLWHPKPVLMSAVITRDDKTKIVTLGKSCPKCHRYFKEGEYVDE